MADIKQEHKSDSGENFAMATNVDPKNMQELTQFVSYFYYIQKAIILLTFTQIIYIFFRFKVFFKECKISFKRCPIKLLEEISFFILINSIRH